MNKKELISEIAKENNLTLSQAGDILNSTLNIILEAAKSGNKVKIKEFGTFELKTKKERKGTNPKTKEPMVIPEQKYIKFSLSSSVKEELNN